MLSKKSLCRSFLLVIYLFFVIHSNVFSQDNIWTTKSPMPKPRATCASCEVDGIIYVIGGLTEDNYPWAVATVEAYDPKNDTWTTKADMPTPRHNFAVCCLNGKIYAIGGSDHPTQPGDAHNTVEEYDPETDTWQSKSPMPTERAYLAACSVDGLIYAFGGKDGANVPRPEVEAYDPTTDTWSRKADMITARNYLAACTTDGKIYALGGAIGVSGGKLSHNEIYDPLTDQWFIKKNMPTARIGLSACSINGKIYATGGQNIQFAPGLNTNEEYDPVTDTWAIMTDMPNPAVWHTTTAVDGKIYAIGGTTDGNVTGLLASVEEYNPSIDLFGLLKEFEINKTYAIAGTDSVCIEVKLNNPEGVTVIAKIQAPDETPVDSLWLYDDGIHNDGNASDSLYANTWAVSPLEEQHYYVDFHVKKADTDTIIHNINNILSFTTVGPVVFDAYKFGEDSIPNPSDLIMFKLNLKNNSLSIAAEDVEAELTCLDSFANITFETQSFSDIAPGAIVESESYYRVKISDDCPISREIFFRVDISCGGYTYWSDTVSITVKEPTEIKNAKDLTPQEFALFQNYPNPFNHVTRIRYEVPKHCYVELKVMNLLGQEICTLIKEEKPAGRYEHLWDAKDNFGRPMTGGIYLICLKTKDLSLMHKMLLVR